MLDFLVKTFNPGSPLFYIMISWAVIWKGIALWVAARNRQTFLYLLLLVINTLGIFEIIYLILLRKDKNH
ncbi:MAG: DUF5652 family protein [Eubacteriales bacterium]|nr:DUF5652 family protein [Eubacteriales bacterium]